VITFSSARGVLASRYAVRLGAAAALSVIGFTAACADELNVWGCVGSWYAVNCVARSGFASDPYVRIVPAPNKDEKDQAAERDQRWEARCRPVIVQDRYGVPRYRYSAPGCEYGVVE
jgi:hypothetical protein